MLWTSVLAFAFNCRLNRSREVETNKVGSLPIRKPASISVLSAVLALISENSAGSAVLVHRSEGTVFQQRASMRSLKYCRGGFASLVSRGVEDASALSCNPRKRRLFFQSCFGFRRLILAVGFAPW